MNNGDKDESDLLYAWCSIHKGYPWKVSLSTSPLNDGCTVAVNLSLAAEFALCKIGDESWTIIDTRLPWPVYSVVPHGGKFYVFDDRADCLAYDFTSRTVARIGSAPKSSSVDKYHVVRSDIELLMVVCYKELDRTDQQKLQIFKLDDDGEEIKWSEIKSIGDCAIFLSGNCSTIARAVDFPECRGDCVYFSAPYGSLQQGLESEVHYIDVLDVKENKFEPIFCRWPNAKKNATWITPSLS